MNDFNYNDVTKWKCYYFGIWTKEMPGALLPTPWFPLIVLSEKQRTNKSKTNLISREHANNGDFFKVSNKIKEFELSI